VEREHFGKVKRVLESDPRKKVTYKEFEEISLFTLALIILPFAFHIIRNAENIFCYII